MKKVTFDFSHLYDIQDFYREFSRRLALDESFGANLDALWDVVTGEIALPLEVEFLHLTAEQRRHFGAIILLFEEAEAELRGELRFTLPGDQESKISPP